MKSVQTALFGHAAVLLHDVNAVDAIATYQITIISEINKLMTISYAWGDFFFYKDRVATCVWNSIWQYAHDLGCDSI